jgi:hypothetical protein
MGYALARVGPEEHVNFAGESFVCGPNGDVLALQVFGLVSKLL